MVLTLFSSRTFAQSTSGSNERKYFGFDLGSTYNCYSGQSNFFYPILGSEPNGASVFAPVAFDGLGTGIGLSFGFKLGVALSNSFDLEVKLRYVTNYTSSTENHTIPVGIVPGVTQQKPVINSYNLLVSNVADDLLAHLKLSDRWYAAGGVSFSALVSDKLFVSQTKDGGIDWAYVNQNTGGLSGDTSVSISESWSNFFANTRLGLVLGGGTVFPIGIGSTLFDAELLLSIPMTGSLQSSGQNIVNSDVTNFDLPSVTYPKLWYASLTIGIRFPFGGSR